MSKQLMIEIEDIENAPEKTLEVNFDDYITDIKSNGSIQANLTFKSLGDFIEAKGNISGKIILECDLCLEEFEYDFDVDIDELFAKNSLQEEYSQETEIKDGQFVIDLMGEKQIDVYDLLYQSVIINLPNKKVCGINCKGDTFLKEEEISDPRLDVFKNINIEKRK